MATLDHTMATDIVVGPPKGMGIAAYPAGATYGARRLMDFEFVWMIEGDAEYTNRGVDVVVTSGSVALCTPGSVDSFRWDTRRRTRHAYFHFDIHVLPSHWPPVETWPVVRRPMTADLLVPLFRHVLNASAKADPIQITHAIAMMVCAFVGGSTTADEIVSDNTPESVARALAFIRRRLDEAPADPLPLAQIAEEAYVSPEHLCRVFKASIGLAPAEMIREMRVERASVLLARSNYTIAEIAELTGFANAYHFARRFKGLRGETPSEFRRRYHVTPPA